jgi:beta-lactamase regulating signal transducer with metallopeptidase domain
MTILVLIDASVRSLLMGSTIFLVLRLFRIRHVRAQRGAWLLALLVSLSMPVFVGLHLGPRLVAEIPMRSTLMPSKVAQIEDKAELATLPLLANVGVHALIKRSGQSETSRPAIVGQRTPGASFIAGGLVYVGYVYVIVAAYLLLRLFLGIALILRLRNCANRTVFQFDRLADIRISRGVTTPVTVASSILLPETYSQWDEATLRMVLAHERAHVRQADFYVLLVSAVHCALFWFSPFSWWLRRQLSELSEALSDLAAVEQAESRASYAEVLLAFVASVRSPRSGVAMAGAFNLRLRIERLLSDRLFYRSYFGKQQLPFLPACLLILTIVASTSVVNVYAAQTEGSQATSVTAPSAHGPKTPPAPPIPPAPAKPPASAARSIVNVPPPSPPPPPPPPPPPGPLDPSTSRAETALALVGVGILNPTPPPAPRAPPSAPTADQRHCSSPNFICCSPASPCAPNVDLSKGK